MRADSAVEPTKSENITVTWRRSARWLSTWSPRRRGLVACMFTECGNGLQYLEPRTKWKTQLTEMIFREVGQDALVYLVLAEYRLILFEAQAPQPNHHVHDGCPSIMGGAHHLPGKQACPGWRWVLRLRRHTLGSNGNYRPLTLFEICLWGLPSPEREAPPGRGPVGASRLRWVKGLRPQRLLQPSLTHESVF